MWVGTGPVLGAGLVPVGGFVVPVGDFVFPLDGFRFPLDGFRFPLDGFRFPLDGFRFPLAGFRFFPVGFASYAEGFPFPPVTLVTRGAFSPRGETPAWRVRPAAQCLLVLLRPAPRVRWLVTVHRCRLVRTR